MRDTGKKALSVGTECADQAGRGPKARSAARVAYEYRLNCGLILNLYTWILRAEENQSVPLRLREIQCILSLDAAFESGIEPEELRDEVFGGGKTSSLNVHIFKLRRKLERLGYEVELVSKRFFLMRKVSAQVGSRESRAAQASKTHRPRVLRVRPLKEGSVRAPQPGRRPKNVNEP